MSKELINYALDYDNKKAAQAVSDNRKNGKKTEKTLVEEKKEQPLKTSLKNSNNSPRMMKMYWQFKLKAIAAKMQADHKRINGAMMER